MFAFVLATIGLILVSYNINQFARRSASPGSLSIYIANGLEPATGVISGWALVLVYLGTAMTLLCGFAIYANTVLAELGFHLSPMILFAVCAGIAWCYAYTDVQLSTVLMLVLEMTSVSLILILACLLKCTSACDLIAQRLYIFTKVHVGVTTSKDELLF